MARDKSSCMADRNKTCELVLRETRFVHKEYKDYVQLIHGLMQVDFGQKHV